MLLCIDIGNTNCVIGLFSGDTLYRSFRVATDSKATKDQYALLLNGLLGMARLEPQSIVGACICSVVPPLTEVFEKLVENYFGARTVVVSETTKTGIVIDYDTPKDVGADRVVNAVAVHERYGQCDVIVVDFGTATTLDAVTADGRYLGGVIVPGVNISLEALFRWTAKLPKVELVRPSTVIGRSTVQSIQSGVYFGYLAMVEGLLARIRKELSEPVKVVATGGLANLICQDCPQIDEIDPDLTIRGLKLIWDMNKD
jgi:type III pantothenate kinase